MLIPYVRLSDDIGVFRSREKHACYSVLCFCVSLNRSERNAVVQSNG